MVVGLLHFPEPGQDGVHLLRPRGIAHRLLQRLELVVEIPDAAAARDGLVEHRAAGHLLDVLAEVADGQLAGHRDLALVGGLLAHDQAEEGGLARAVGTHESDLLARVELERRVDEEELTAVLLAQAGKGDHRAGGRTGIAVSETFTSSLDPTPTPRYSGGVTAKSVRTSGNSARTRRPSPSRWISTVPVTGCLTPCRSNVPVKGVVPSKASPPTSLRWMSERTALLKPSPFATSR